MGYALTELGPDRCRTIAEGLFKVEKVYGGVKLHGFCPIHGDKGSASFVYHFVDDWYKCQSCGTGGDLVKLWCEIHGYDSHGEGFKKFKEEFVGDSDSTGGKKHVRRIPAPRVEPVEAPEVWVDEAHYAALPPLPAESITELRRLRGWSPQTIETQGLREFTDSRGNKRIAIPIRDVEGRLCNIRLYQPGAAQFKVISWFDPACVCGGKWHKVEKAKVCATCGAAPLDYGRTRLWPSPAQWSPSGALWLCEGEPDTICALSQGLNAVTQTAGAGTWRDEFSVAMAGRDVIIAYDADKTGHKGALGAAESIVLQARSVRVIRWPEIMGGKNG